MQHRSHRLPTVKFRAYRNTWPVAYLQSIAFLATLLIAANSQVAAQSQVRIRLKNNGFVAGRLVNAEFDDHVAIQCSDFSNTLHLQVQSILSVNQLERNGAGVIGERIFVLTSGMSIAGTLTGLDEQSVTIASPSLGTVKLPRALLREFSDVNYAGRLVYSGPRSGQDWIGENPEDWIIEAGAIASSKANATIIGDVNLPDKCEVRFSLSWTRTPDFVLSLGCTNAAKTDSAALKLEVWDGELAMVREVGNSVDLALIPNFSAESNRLNLSVYLDQINGIAAVCTPLGRILEKLELKSDKVAPARFIKLSNHSQENYSSVLRLERLEVREWDGHLPDGKDYSAGQLVTAAGDIVDGELGVLDAATGEATVLQDGKQIAKIKLSEIRRALLAHENHETASGEVTEVNAQATENGSDNEVDAQAKTKASLIEIEFLDRSRLVGRWKAKQAGKIGFQVTGFDELFFIEADQIVSMFGSSDAFTAATLPNPRGRLTAQASELFGCLVSDNTSPLSTLVWLPEASSVPLYLSGTASGRIAFDTKAPRSPNSDPRPLPANRALMLPLVVPGGAKPATATAARSRKLTVGLEFRTGDVVEGQVTKIDETGVTFSSSSTNTTFVPHAEMESVTLRTIRGAGNESPEKIERLMTVPRAMKADPPTHLLVSTSGDYLRGRLISLGEEKTTVEIRLEIIELPTEQIAQIFWLHDRQWELETNKTAEVTADETASDKDKIAANSGDASLFQVHAIRDDSRGITFVPTKLADGKLYGKSTLLGDCEIPLEKLQLLLFGRDVGTLARELKKELWKLSLATLPKVYQDGEGGTENLSPLVGKPAPNFTLQALDGESQQLSKYIGRVVVLDFWASWCGPCMKTMPEVERVITEIGDDQVDLIAVNLQESNDKATAAMKRLGMSATVLLDIDGEVAQLYQANAIPQTIIIDRSGNITHVFVGGGNKFVQDFSNALKSTIEVK